MAAGSIVGASRGSAVHAAGRLSEVPPARARQARPRAALLRSEQWCRASLVKQLEGVVLIPEACLEALPLLPEGVCAPAAARSVWLALTTNTLTLYDSASRRVRLATFPLRKLRYVAALESNAVEGDAGHGLLIGFHPSVPATTRPTPLPGAVVDGELRFATLYAASAEKQLRWVAALRQAADPKPPAAAVQPHPSQPSAITAAAPRTDRPDRCCRSGVSAVSMAAPAPTPGSIATLAGRGAAPPAAATPFRLGPGGLSTGAGAGAAGHGPAPQASVLGVQGSLAALTAAVWATPVDAAVAISAEEMEDDPVVAAVAAVAVEAAAAVVTDIG